MLVLLPAFLRPPATVPAATATTTHLTQDENASVHRSSSDDGDRPSYYERNRDKVRENQRRYRESNREKIRAINKAHYRKNRAKITKHNRGRWLQKQAMISTAADMNTINAPEQQRQHPPAATHKMRLTLLLNPVSE
ncbi:Aste57867_4114 [Aphanomyces stellatus]|uniref:Aste57867_4114 protein n=1 Tax=Aphanomyces stellatus TaxID=120398 RepID=A0A485KC53_9STRA|nr:hypothetical protein As57867_004103 [Aphanomyces stellatus]VFT81245.1 Aste57867_4114 [Aphanomyces stellatus]